METQEVQGIHPPIQEHQQQQTLGDPLRTSASFAPKTLTKKGELWKTLVEGKLAGFTD